VLRTDARRGRRSLPFQAVVSRIAANNVRCKSVKTGFVGEALCNVKTRRASGGSKNFLGNLIFLFLKFFWGNLMFSLSKKNSGRSVMLLYFI